MCTTNKCEIKKPLHGHSDPYGHRLTGKPSRCRNSALSVTVRRFWPPTGININISKVKNAGLEFSSFTTRGVKIPIPRIEKIVRVRCCAFREQVRLKHSSQTDKYVEKSRLAAIQKRLNGKNNTLRRLSVRRDSYLCVRLTRFFNGINPSPAVCPFLNCWRRLKSNR